MPASSDVRQGQAAYAHRFFRLKKDVADKITGRPKTPSTSVSPPAPQAAASAVSKPVEGNTWSEIGTELSRQKTGSEASCAAVDVKQRTSAHTQAIHQHLFGSGALTVPPKTSWDKHEPAPCRTLRDHVIVPVRRSPPASSRMRRREVLRQQDIYRQQLDAQIRSNGQLRELERRKLQPNAIELGVFGTAGRRIVSPKRSSKAASEEPTGGVRRSLSVFGSEKHSPMSHQSTDSPPVNDESVENNSSPGTELKKSNGSYLCGMWFERTEEEMAAKGEKRRKLKRDLELQMREKESQRQNEVEASLIWEKKFGFKSDTLPWLADKIPTERKEDAQSPDDMASEPKQSNDIDSSQENDFGRVDWKSNNFKSDLQPSFQTATESTPAPSLGQSISVSSSNTDDFFDNITLKQPSLMQTLDWKMARIGDDFLHDQELNTSTNTGVQQVQDRSLHNAANDGSCASVPPTLTSESVFLAGPLENELNRDPSPKQLKSSSATVPIALTDVDTIDNLLLDFLKDPLYLN